MSQLKAKTKLATDQLLVSKREWEGQAQLKAYEAELAEKEVEKVSAVLEKRSKELKQKEDEIRSFELEAKKLNAALITAHQDTTAAKKQILKIWTEMRKAKEATARKTKAPEDASASQTKKLNTET